MSPTTVLLDVPRAIAQRRSIKVFKPDPIAPELQQQPISLTAAAPSSAKSPDWRIVLV
jgi:nitroreductase